MRITGQLPQPPRPMGRPETVPASERGIGRPEEKPEKKGPVGPPETVPVRKGIAQADAPKADEGQAQQGQGSTVAATKRYHGRIGKWMNELRELVRGIKNGEQVPVNKVEKALHLTQKLTAFLEDKSKLPDERTQELIGRLKGFQEVFTQYLAQQSAPPEPVPVPLPEPLPDPVPLPVEPAPVEPVVEKLPTEGLVV